MIDYLEQVLGLTAGTLHTDFGILISLVILMVCFYAIVKVILTWLSALFGGKK